MKSVFADAFYFVALLNRTDQHHAKAIAFARQSRGDILTSEWILMEVADALAESSSRRSVAPFIRDLGLDPKVRIIHASQELFEKGLQLYDQRPDKDWPLTDCISFVLMKDEKLTEALTGDRHFEQAGFKALLA